MSEAKPAAGPQPMDLGDLIKAAGPLAEAYFEARHDEQQQEIDYDLKVIAQETKRFQHLLIFGGAVAFGVFVLAGLLIFRGEASQARELIGFIVGVVAAAFGGYGIAKGAAVERDKET